MRASHRVAIKRCRVRNYPAVFELLEPRLLMDAFEDFGLGDDWAYDDGSSSDAPPAYTQPADTQPAYTQPAGTQPSDTQPSDTQPSMGDSSGDGSESGSGDGGQTDDSSADYCPLPTADTCPVLQNAPRAPHNLTAQPLSSSSVFLTWRHGSNDQSGFNIARAGADGVWHEIATVGANATHFTNSGLMPGTTYTYAVIAFNDAGFSPYSNLASATTLDAGDPTLVGQFGHLPGGASSAPLTFHDADGTKVTLTLSGPGTGAVHLNPEGYSITLTGTTLASTLQITTAKSATPGDDGRFELASFSAGNPAVTGDRTALGALNAGTTDLSGGLTITGAARKITLGNVTGEETLSIAAGVAGVASLAPVTLAFGQVADASLVSGVGIASLTMTRWTAPDNGDQIAAPYLGSLHVTGRNAHGSTPQVQGDFQASLLLSGEGISGKKTVLGNATIAGAISGGTWQIAGAVSKITAQSSSDWALTLTDGGAEAGSLGSLTVHGRMTGTQIRSSGNMGKVKVGLLDHSLIFAGVLGTVSALPVAAGDFAGVLPAGLPAIKNLTLTNVAGNAAVLIDSDIAAGAIGRVSLPPRASAILDVDANELFGFATADGDVGKYVGPVSGGNFVSGKDSVVS